MQLNSLKTSGNVTIIGDPSCRGSFLFLWAFFMFARIFFHYFSKKKKKKKSLSYLSIVNGLGGVDLEFLFRYPFF